MIDAKGLTGGSATTMHCDHGRAADNLAAAGGRFVRRSSALAATSSELRVSALVLAAAAALGVGVIASADAAWAQATSAQATSAQAAPASPAEAERQMFGHDEDIAYARLLWQVMEAGRLVGPSAIRSYPYDGLPPHGVLLEIFYTDAEVGGEVGELIVKRNYGVDAVTQKEIIANPDAYLTDITVMFRRAEGWDPEIDDWFWAQYAPDGALMRSANETAMAGAVGKNLDDGCVACHIAAAGSDFVFTADYPVR